MTGEKKNIKPIYAGVDVGASRTKAALLDREGNILGWDVVRSGTDFAASAQRCLQGALDMAGKDRSSVAHAFSTGYGRLNVPYTDGTKTEISCHARGCYYYFPTEITVIDIGGQDNKVIKLDSRGRRTAFKMNRKCAAGTGAFLEEMSLRLDIPLEQMNELAARATGVVKLGSYCTVFSATEVLERIREGKKLPDIVKGLFLSVVKRIVEMDSLGERVVLTGGVVAHNPLLADMMKDLIGRDVLVPELPQLTGAIGAALFAREAEGKMIKIETTE